MKLIMVVSLLPLFAATAGLAQTAMTATAASSAAAAQTTPDSSSSEDDSLPPLTLEPLFNAGDSTPSFSLWPDSARAKGSWMLGPKPYYFEHPPLDFVFGASAYGAAPETSEFRSGGWLLDSRSNLMSPWNLEMESRSKYRILRTIFSTVQAGGVAYLLYLHVKKYGLK